MPLEPWVAHLVYGLAWLSFGAGHSWLANASVKARLRPWLGSGERLAYNLFAMAHITVVLAVGWWTLGEAPAIARPGWLEAAMLVVSGLGVVLLLYFARSYDLSRFAGRTSYGWRGAATFAVRRQPTTNPCGPMVSTPGCGIRCIRRHFWFCGAARSIRWGLRRRCGPASIW